MITDKLREAAALIRANPTVITEIEKEEAEKAKAAAAESARIAKAQARVAGALEERARALVDDFDLRERQAIEDAAHWLARKQLEAENGLVPMATRALAPEPVRLGRTHVETFWKKLIDSAPIPWAKGRSGHELRVAQTREASAFQEAQRQAGREAQAERDRLAAARDVAEREYGR